MPLRMTEGLPLVYPARRREPATETPSARDSADARAAQQPRASRRFAGARASRVCVLTGAAGAHGRKLGVPRRRQRQPDWCWAACVDMVLHYYGRREVEQCEIVGRKIKRADSCDDPLNKEFGVPCAPKWMRGVWASWGLEARSHFPRKGRPGWISEVALKRELEAGRPVEVGLCWDNGGGHAVVVRGWCEGRGGRTFYFVNDPWNWADDERGKFFAEGGVGQVSYAELRAAYGMGRWKWTWTGISPKG